MKVSSILVVLLTIVLDDAFNQQPQTSIALLPQPVSVQIKTGNFILSNKTAIELSSTDADTKRVSDFLSKKLAASTGYPMPVKVMTTVSNTSGKIRLALVKDAAIGD